MGASSPPPSEASRRLGAAIRARRLDLDLSQDQFAEQLGLLRSRVSAIENGRIGQTRLLLEVCTALGLELLALPREDPVTASLVSAQQRLVKDVTRRTGRSGASSA